MSDYKVGDKYECIEDFYMNPSSGGNCVFTKGKIYVIEEKSEHYGDTMMVDDANDNHYMDAFNMEQHFRKVKVNTQEEKSYDSAMGVL